MTITCLIYCNSTPGGPKLTRWSQIFDNQKSKYDDGLYFPVIAVTSCEANGVKAFSEYEVSKILLLFNLVQFFRFAPCSLFNFSSKNFAYPGAQLTSPGVLFSFLRENWVPRVCL